MITPSRSKIKAVTGLLTFAILSMLSSRSVLPGEGLNRLSASFYRIRRGFAAGTPQRPRLSASAVPGHWGLPRMFLPPKHEKVVKRRPGVVDTSFTAHHNWLCKWEPGEEFVRLNYEEQLRCGVECAFIWPGKITNRITGCSSERPREKRKLQPCKYR